MTVDRSPTPTELIHAVEQADSPSRLFSAVRSLSAAAIPEAIPTLIRVLGFNNPGAAVCAVEGLVTLGDRAVPELLHQIDGYNYGARAWAIRALSRIGHPDALLTLIDAACTDFSLSVRRAAAKGLGFVHWHKLDGEVLAAQQQSLEALLQVCADPEWVVRYAAIAGLQELASAMGTHPEPISKIVAQLDHLVRHDDTPAVQARAQVAREAIATG
jgi:phycocyanobilin lyase subunit beta